MGVYPSGQGTGLQNRYREFNSRHALQFIEPPTGPRSQHLPSSLGRCAPSFVSPDADGPSSALDPSGRIIKPPTGPRSQHLPSSLGRCAPSFVSPDADGPSSALDPSGRIIKPPTEPRSQHFPPRGTTTLQHRDVRQPGRAHRSRTGGMWVRIPLSRPSNAGQLANGIAACFKPRCLRVRLPP